MCGIAGYVDFNAPPDRRVLDAKTDSLAHRGPDDQSTLIVGPCGLGHTRLSVIDLAGGSQPMTTPTGNAFISFGGEIYNFEHIRAQLESSGERLRTRSDTEVLLRLVARKWTDALPKLDGMFSFAVWDAAGQRLLLARDVAGEKPIFYATPAPGVLVFASEAKAVLQHPSVSRELDIDALRQVLRFRAIYGERCLHAGVKQLPPGHWLEFDRSGLRIGRYFDLVEQAVAARKRLKAEPDDVIIENGRQIFMQAVQDRMVADVPVGAFLSGGLDSSLIVAAIRQLRGPDAELRTYSTGFEGDPHSELVHARRVAELVGSVHTEVEVGPKVFAERLSQLSACRDAPVSEPADLAIAEMSRIARQDVKVVLCGEGADELFAGYPKYSLASSPPALRLLLRACGPNNAQVLANILGLDRSRTRVAIRALIQRTELDRLVQWFSNFDRSELSRLFPGLGWTDDDWTKTMSEQSRAITALAAHAIDPIQRMQLVDCFTWLPGNMLERDDRMTMAEGLELRAPFLHKELMVYGLGLPTRFKRRHGVGKWVVRQWARGVLPDNIIDRRKWGFRVPLDLWFRGALRERLEGYLLSDRGLCAAYGDRAGIRRLIDGHLAGRNHSAALWTLYSAEVWYQDVFKPRLAASAKGLAA